MNVLQVNIVVNEVIYVQVNGHIRKGKLVDIKVALCASTSSVVAVFTVALDLLGGLVLKANN